MIFGKDKSIKDGIISTGRKLYELRLVVARSGNLSARSNEGSIFVTRSQASLGDLSYDDIIKVDPGKEEDCRNDRLTSEFPLHRLIYRDSPSRVVIHCHPTLVNAYFAVCPELKTLTFETRLYLGNVPVVEQDTPSVTRPELVTDALKSSSLVVIRNHGVVSVADKFIDALYLIETLEEAVKTASVARLFKKEVMDVLDKELKENFNQDNAYLMFSGEHIQAIVDLVNRDEFIAKKGQEQDLTLKLAIKLDGHNKIYRFDFEKGKIVKLGFDDDAPFVISASADIWELIFLGKLDPFVATTQGKMKLKGELGKLSRWYVPFSRLFELFRQVKIK